MMRPPLLITLCVSLAFSLIFLDDAQAEPVFLQGATSATVTDVILAKTQGSTCCPECAGNNACPDCGCWPTALGMLLAYWDDTPHGTEGPWEQLLPGGHGDDDDAFQSCTQSLFDIYGGASCACSEADMYLWFYCVEDRTILSTYTASLGYEFNIDSDEWVWWGTDVTDEIDAGRPVYYAYYPEGSGAHSVLVVGYDNTDESLWFYNTRDHAAHVRGFDEADDHCVLNVTPGGRDCDIGQCCDSGYFLPEGGICQINAGMERSCEWGTGCGDDVAERVQDRTCSGMSADCDGSLVPNGDWTLAQDCGATEVCFPDDGSCRSDDTCGGVCECTAGDCCDGCHFIPESGRCDDTPITTEYQCDGGCGGSGERRRLFRNCTGSSTECGADNPMYEEWTDVVQCNPDEICVAAASQVSCHRCPEGCSDGICLGCTPNCSGRECGFDGCGGTCGDCSSGHQCSTEGLCEAVAQPPPPVDNDPGGCSCRGVGRGRLGRSYLSTIRF